MLARLRLVGQTLSWSTPAPQPLPAAASMLLLRRPRAAVGSWARALCTPASAHLAVLQLYRLQPAPVPPGLQPRLLFADGQARSAEESAARLAEASDRGEVVLVTESALRQLLAPQAHTTYSIKYSGLMKTPTQAHTHTNTQTNDYI